MNIFLGVRGWCNPRNTKSSVRGSVTILRAKKFKEAFNKLLQDTWANIDFKKILNNEEYVLINLIHVKEELVGDIQLQKNWNENIKPNNKSTINWREENFSDKR